MSDLAVEITGFVVGDDLEIRRTVTNLPAAIATAWLTVKNNVAQPDDQALLLKKVTVSNVEGTGQIVTAGGDDEEGDLRFDLVQADTVKLGAKKHIYDIQIKLSTGRIYTIEKGSIELTEGVTQSTT
jgi:hypothetical protein